VLNQMEAARSAFEGMVQSAREGGDKVAEGRALFWLSFVQTRLSHMADARAAGDTAIEVARQASDTRILAGAHWNLGRLHEASGELGLASRHLDEAERLARLEGDGTLVGRCLMEKARLSTWNGDYVGAERRAAEGLELARAGRESIFLAGVCWILGIARGEQGHYSQALEALHHGLAYAVEADDLHYPVKILNTLGWLHGEIGDAQTALRYDREALEASRRGPADPIREAECYCLLNLATDELQTGNVEAAELYLRDFEATDTGVEYARFHYLNRYHLARAQLALAKDDPEEALRWAKGAEDAAAAKAVRKNLAKSWMLTGQAFAALQRPREAAEYLRCSVAVADELGHGSLRWQARLGLARVSVLIHQMTEAAAAVDVARELVDAIASDLRDDRLREAFRCSRLVQEVGGVATELQRPAETLAHPAGLTAREVEVLCLVTQGATNKDIARALHISVKTVNAHLNNIFIKVDCSTRAAAAAFAVRHGLV
jgi:DNA-binding CsgD family transcriptional regulator